MYNIKAVIHKSNGVKIKLGLEEIPAAFADFAGITEAAAQIILSVVVIFAILLPVLYLSKADKTTSIIFTFMGMALCVGLGWLPFWLIIASVALMAFAIAALGTNAIVGSD